MPVVTLWWEVSDFAFGFTCDWVAVGLLYCLIVFLCVIVMFILCLLGFAGVCCALVCGNHVIAFLFYSSMVWIFMSC